MSDSKLDAYGNQIYLNDKGEYHREDGPAIINIHGNMYWYKNNLLHREDGPAVEYTSGTKQWWLDGSLHREDGPAIEFSNGEKSWHYYGKIILCYSQEEFLKIIKMKAFW